MTPTDTSTPFHPLSATISTESGESTSSSSAPSDDPLGRALEALASQRPAETIALARLRLQADPADAFAFAVLGVALCQIGETASALQALERAHYLNPHDARILYNYGLVLEECGRPAAARIRFMAALKLSPQYSRALEHLTRLEAEPPVSGDEATEETAPPAAVPLDRLRENEFQSAWMKEGEGFSFPPSDPLPSARKVLSDLPPTSVPATGDAPTPNPIHKDAGSLERPTTSANGYHANGEPARQEIETGSDANGSRDNAATANAAAIPVPTPTQNRTDRTGRRVTGSLVTVTVVALGLLAGAVAVKAWHSSNPTLAARAAVGEVSSTGAAVVPAAAPEGDEAGPGGASHRRARMSGADLTGKSLSKADFEKADLTRAQLVGADLSFASLIHAVLIHADLRKANLERANLLGARLREADLREANLRHSYLKAAELSNANLSDAKLDDAILTYAELRQTILINAQLPHAEFKAAFLNRANLQGANLEGADLSSADLSGANLRGARLDSAKLTGARFDKDTRWPEGFQPTQKGARLSSSAPE